VSLVQSAIYSSDSGVHIHADHGLSTVVGQGDTAPSLTLEVALEPYDVVDVLKCDTEGSEFEIFLGAPRETMSKIKLLTLEFHDYFGEDRRNSLLDKFSETHDLSSSNFRPGSGGVYTGLLK